MLLDLHVHSCYSKDCKSPVPSIVAHAIASGLDGIAICDHDTTKGSQEAQRLVKEKGYDLLVIPGIEVTTTQGHLLLLGTNEEIPKNSEPEEVIRLARERDCLVIAPHPYKGFPKSLGDVSGLDVDAVETLNSRYILGRFNKKAEKMAEELDLPMVGNSDAHFVDMVGRAYTEIDSDSSVDEVFKAILSGRTRVFGTRTPLAVQLKQACIGAKRRALNLL